MSSFEEIKKELDSLSNSEIQQMWDKVSKTNFDSPNVSEMFGNTKYSKEGNEKCFTDINEQIPEKGKDLIVITTNNERKFVFRCACSYKDCNAYRDGLFGYELNIDIKSWKYVD